MTASTTRGWTFTGLLIALFGLPAIVTASRLLAENPKSDGAIVFRELAILALTAFLLWIVVRGEKRPLSSIQLRTDQLGRTLAWGFGLAVVCFGVLVLCLVGFSAFGIHYGEGASIAPSLPVAFLAVLAPGFPKRYSTAGSRSTGWRRSSGASGLRQPFRSYCSPAFITAKDGPASSSPSPSARC